MVYVFLDVGHRLSQKGAFLRHHPSGQPNMFVKNFSKCQFQANDIHSFSMIYECMSLILGLCSLDTRLNIYVFLFITCSLIMLSVLITSLCLLGPV